MIFKLSRVLREIAARERIEKIKELEKKYGVLEDDMNIPEEDLIFDELELGKVVDEGRKKEKRIEILEECEKFC